MVLPFNVALYSGVSVAALFAAAGADAYAVGGNSPEFVADFAGVLNSGTEYYRSGGSDTTFEGVFTHSGLVLPATMTDSDGVLKWAPHNRLPRSQEFDQWQTNATVTVTANASTAPDGTSTADEIDATNNFSGVFRSSFETVAVGDVRTYGIFVKNVSGSTQWKIRFQGAVTAEYIFDVADQSTVLNTAGTTVSVSDAGNGWFLYKMTFTMNGAGALNAVFYKHDAGNGVVYAWGAHVYRSDLGGMVNNPDRGDSYVPTTTAARFLPRRNHHIYNGTSWEKAGILIEPANATNLFQYSDSLATFPWGVANGTISSNAATGGDGQSTADKLIPNNGSAFCALTQTVSVSAAVHTISFEAEANGFNFVQVYITGVGHCNFDLSSGTVGASSGSWVGQIQEVRNGVYRCSVTTGSLSAGSTTFRFAIPVNSSSALGALATGDGTSGINLWGMQLEVGSTATSYIPTSGSTATRALETLTVAGANLPYSATAMSMSVSGRLTYEDNGSGYSLFSWSTVATAHRINLGVATVGVSTGNPIMDVRNTTDGSDASVGSTDYYSPGVNVPINLAGRITNSEFQLAYDGTSVAVDTDPTTMPSLASENLAIRYLVSTVRVWGADIGTSGIEEA